MTSVLWLIVGRAGSKSVPGKNLRRIGDRSLVRWKLDGARPAMRLGDLLLCSTDSMEIADEARVGGATVKWMRPAELATDTAASIDVVLHAMANCGGVYDAVMLLEPSSPYTLPRHYAAALAHLRDGADAAIGMRAVEPHPMFTAPITADGCIRVLSRDIARMGRANRRQDLPMCWTASGGMYLCRWEILERTRSFYGSDKTYGVMMEWPWCIEIDHERDLALAEFAHERGLV